MLMYRIGRKVINMDHVTQVTRKNGRGNALQTVFSFLDGSEAVFAKHAQEAWDLVKENADSEVLAED